MIKYQFLIFITLLLLSCNQANTELNIYPNDSTMTNSSGAPKDSLSFYLPFKIKKDTQTILVNIDTFILKSVSASLYYAKEPILFNFYQGHDIYRFLWLRSFGNPIVFSLNKDGNKIWLTTKKLSRNPTFEDIPAVEYGYVIKADPTANIIFNQTKQLTETDWQEFEKLLGKCSFWTSNFYDRTIGQDGSRWTIEAHLKNKYWIVSKYTPRDNFKKAGEFLITKSGLKEEIY